METSHSSELQLLDRERVCKGSAETLMELVAEVEKANSFIKNSTCSKLQTIVEQMKFLQQQAHKILQEGEKNAALHKVDCNFVKHPGRIYHLYERSSGKEYFSMISPEEWGTSSPRQEYKGSFRLEQDQSWTPLAKIAERDNTYEVLENFLSDTGHSKTLQISQILND